MGSFLYQYFCSIACKPFSLLCLKCAQSALSWDFFSGSATWTQLTASGGPPGLLWHTAVIIDQQMIVYGGVTDPISGSVNADVWRFFSFGMLVTFVFPEDISNDVSCTRKRDDFWVSHGPTWGKGHLISNDSYDINGSTWKKFDRVVDKSPVGRAGIAAPDQ